jgi:mRNA-degrading endonuclease RelE of RelBE toxin-antitoxin system
VTEEDPYELDLAPAARRVLEVGPPRGLPLAIAVAVGNFVRGPLLAEPYRVGKALTFDLDGYRAARRGDYRVIYRIDDDKHIVNVLRIEHRADVYRPR